MVLFDKHATTVTQDESVTNVLDMNSPLVLFLLKHEHTTAVVNTHLTPIFFSS